MTGVADSILTFRPVALGREVVMLGRVQVGEIIPNEGRYQACFRLTLPDASASSWRPVRDLVDARRLAAIKINDWLNAADLRPNG